MDKLMKLIKDMMWALAIGIMIVGLAILTSMAYERLFGKDLGSVIQGSEYHATNTAAFGSDSTLIQAASTHGTAVILGNIVVGSTTPFWMQIYDATSTAAVTAGVYSTLVGTLESSVTEGTYTFDASLQDGLVIVNEASFDGSYTIMFR